jgi:hypothetical protein
VTRVLLSAAQLAAKLNQSLDWWYHNRPALEAAGFPTTVPGMGKRWDPVAVDAWLDLQVPGHLRAALPVAEKPEPDLAAELAERARALVATH